jgi:hypothetical protein
MHAIAFASAAALTLGLVGGWHCVGMCAAPRMTAAHTIRLSPKPRPLREEAALQAGRVFGYALLGGLVGALGQIGDTLAIWAGLSAVTARVAVLGLALLAISHGLRLPVAPVLASLGMPLWRWLSAALPRAAWARGILWAAVPCGLSYSALPLSLIAGSAAGGAGVMLAFGVGTLPWHGLAPAARGAFLRLPARYSRAIALPVGLLLLFLLALPSALKAPLHARGICL